IAKQRQRGFVKRLRYLADGLAPRCRIGAGERIPCEFGAEYPAQPIVRADLGETVRRRGPGFLEREGVDQNGRIAFGRLENEWPIVVVPKRQAIFEQRREYTAHPRLAALDQAFGDVSLVGIRGFAQLADSSEKTRVIESLAVGDAHGQKGEN